MNLIQTIQATVGYREVFHNGEVAYYSGHSNEGYIYKDEDAFNNKNGVCYIPECSFDDTDDNVDCVLATAENSYDYSAIRELVKNFIAQAEVQTTSDEFIDYLTADTFESVDWECVETYLNEVDIQETFTEWLVEDVKKHLSKQSIKDRSHRPDKDQTFGIVLGYIKDNYGTTKKCGWDAAWKVLDEYKLENKHY